MTAAPREPRPDKRRQPNTRNSTHTLQPDYNPETIRAVVREWTRAHRGVAPTGDIIHPALARALDALLNEYRA